MGEAACWLHEGAWTRRWIITREREREREREKKKQKRSKKQQKEMIHNDTFPMLPHL